MGNVSARADDVQADFQLVDKIGSRQAYESFLKAHPTGPQAEIARRRLEELPVTPAARVPVQRSPDAITKKPILYDRAF